VGGGHKSPKYDANNNLIKAIDGSGVTAPSEKAAETLVTFDTLDRVARSATVRLQRQLPLHHLLL
jgi:L-asparaginase/Glu-tRNA(Gln) amidotransferase subunit D